MNTSTPWAGSAAGLHGCSGRSATACSTQPLLAQLTTRGCYNTRYLLDPTAEPRWDVLNMVCDNVQEKLYELVETCKLIRVVGQLKNSTNNHTCFVMLHRSNKYLWRPLLFLEKPWLELLNFKFLKKSSFKFRFVTYLESTQEFCSYTITASQISAGVNRPFPFAGIITNNLELEKDVLW